MTTVSKPPEHVALTLLSEELKAIGKEITPVIGASENETVNYIPTDHEINALAEAEAQISDAISAVGSAFVKIGEALDAIRTERLWHGVQNPRTGKNYTEFDEYLRDRWEFSEVRATQYIGAAKVAEQVSSHTDVLIPNEAVGREMVKIAKKHGVEAAAEILEEAAAAREASYEVSGKGNPLVTANDVRAAAERLPDESTKTKPAPKQMTSAQAWPHIDNSLPKLQTAVALMKPALDQETADEYLAVAAAYAAIAADIRKTVPKAYKPAPKARSKAHLTAVEDGEE